VCLTLTGEQATYLYRARRFDEAARAWSAQLRVRDDAGPHEGLFHLHRAGGRPQAAAAEALRVMALAGVPRASIDALAGRAAPEVVRAFLHGTLAHLCRPGSWTGPERLALVQAALGEADGALDLLDRACREHSPGLPATLRDPAFDALRGTPRFRGVLDCAGLGATAPPTTLAAARTLPLAVAPLPR
ncbi:MAG TPA: hypothetical protein VFO85_03665, partial [Vicinamibacteria bacterium]|nr:hypothetical protein [Vicinamibacteria bacterium]